MSKINRRRIIWTVLCYVGLVLFLVLTDPRRLPLALLIVPFVLLAVALSLTFNILLTVVRPRLARPRRLFFASCLAGVPTFMLILNSVNQLTWRDVLLVVILLLCLLFYAARLDIFRP